MPCIYDVYRICSNYDYFLDMYPTYVTQECFAEGFVDGANAGAALYEGWCTGDDHRFTDILGTLDTRLKNET